MNIDKREHIEKRRADAEIQFENSLRRFVRAWSPDNHRDRYEMQTQLSLLLRLAMQSQTATMAMGIEHYASQSFEMHSLRSLDAIFDVPKKTEGQS